MDKIFNTNNQQNTQKDSMRKRADKRTTRVTEGDSQYSKSK